VLEGGYNTNLGSLSPLAQSVTFHVRALIRTNTIAMSSESDNGEKASEVDIQEVGNKRSRLNTDEW